MLFHDVPVPPAQAAAVLSEAMQQQRQISLRPSYGVNTRNGQITVVGELDPFRDDRKPFNIHTVSQ